MKNLKIGMPIDFKFQIYKRDGRAKSNEVKIPGLFLKCLAHENIKNLID